MTKTQNLHSLVLALTGVSNKLTAKIERGAPKEEISDLAELEELMIGMVTEDALALLPSIVQ